jgi:MFS family permease
MTPTILILLGGLGILLAGVGLLGTVLGVRATTAAFANLEIGLIMAGYYAGYIVGTLIAPRLIRNVGHVRCFAAFAAVAAATSLQGTTRSSRFSRWPRSSYRCAWFPLPLPESPSHELTLLNR